MRTPYEWLIGTRYLRSTHRRGFVSFRGADVRSRPDARGGDAHHRSVRDERLRARVAQPDPERHLPRHLERHRRLHHRLAARYSSAALKQPGVQAAVPYIEEQSMLANGVHVAGATVRGVLPDEERKATGPCPAPERRDASRIWSRASTTSFSAARWRASCTRKWAARWC